MTQTAINYAKALYELPLGQDEVGRIRESIATEPRLLLCLDSPVVKKQEKYRVIDRIFQGNTARFLKLLCKYGRIGLLPEILSAYGEYYDRQQGILRARLYAAGSRNNGKQAFQTEEIRQFLAERFACRQVLLEEKQDDGLLGGYLLEAGGMEFDHSYQGRLRQLERKLTGR